MLRSISNPHLAATLALPLRKGSLFIPPLSFRYPSVVVTEWYRSGIGLDSARDNERISIEKIKKVYIFLRKLLHMSFIYSTFAPDFGFCARKSMSKRDLLIA